MAVEAGGWGQTYLRPGLLFNLLDLILQVSLHLLVPLLSSLVFPFLEPRQEVFPLILIKHNGLLGLFVDGFARYGLLYPHGYRF